MTYVLVAKGEVVAYPYSFEQLRRDHPDVSFPREPDEKWLTEWGVYEVAATEVPQASSIEKDVVEDLPMQINGVWSRVWKEVDASPQQIASRQRKVVDAEIFTAVKADAFVSSFIDMTPSQVVAHVQNAPNTVAGLKAVITKLALMVLVLSRREFK